MEGNPFASTIERDIRQRLEPLRDRGATPTLATVTMTDSAADERFVQLKHDRCFDLEIPTRRVDLDPGAPAEQLYERIESLGADPAVTAVFVQAPLPKHVDELAVRTRIPPTKDADCFHPENLGRLAAGDPRIEPVTPRAVFRLLDRYGVTIAGRDVVVVGRSGAIGRPLATQLLTHEGDPTVTICHTHTEDLTRYTRRADVLITAAGRPELITGPMVSEGVSIVDVSSNWRQNEDGDIEVVGDVEFSTVREKAAHVTPVPGGVGPVTLATMIENLVLLAESHTQV